MSKVFISSTLYDLRGYREAACRAVKRRELAAIDSDDWESVGAPPLAVCLERIDRLDPAEDVVVVIVARWYGSVPAEQQAGDYKSFTWLECERAIARGVKVLSFVLDEAYEPWPAEACEPWRLEEATRRRRTDKSIRLDEVADLVDRNEAALTRFKTWLDSVSTRTTFRSDESLKMEVFAALAPWAQGPTTSGSATAVLTSPDFDRAGYLRELADACEPLDLLGQDAKEANGARLRNVYVPAVLQGEGPERALRMTSGGVERAPLLLDRIGESSIYLSGDPGAGKSTFCKWLALVAANGDVPLHPEALQAPEGYGETCNASLRDRLPVLCSLRDLGGRSVRPAGGGNERPILAGNGTWNSDEFVEALARWAEVAKPCGLTGTALRESLQSGNCLLILDGVDELPRTVDEGTRTHAARSNFLSGLAAALRKWGNNGNRILLTSRPYGLEPSDVQRLGLPHLGLGGIPDDLQALFVRRWYAAVDPPRSTELSRTLVAHLAERQDDGIVEMRRNPMLLTALCVRFHEGQTLPKNVFDLYDKVIDVVLYRRYPHDPNARAKMRRRLAAIALGMHTGIENHSPRRTPAARVEHLEAHRILAQMALDVPRDEGSKGALSAEDKCEELLSNSGLLTPAGTKEAQFYHLSIQEFLAAERLRCFHAGKDPATLGRVLQERNDTPEWRRTLSYLFAADFHGRREHTFNDYIRILRPHLTDSALRRSVQPALVLADAIEIAQANGLDVSDLEREFFGACKVALAASFDPSARIRLWEVAGRVGFDRRRGVGLDPTTKLPDIHWCQVAPAEIELDDGGGRQPVASFAIAKYPVTHAQFQAFIDADDGYSDSKWWDPEGGAWTDLTQPPHARWTAPNGPREAVSWYEASAFCRWLTNRLAAVGQLPEGRIVRLPTEFEWQCAAAGGDPSRKFPWHGEFEPHRANTSEGNARRTSPVGLYPDGNAANGACDMAGNVWEWCHRFEGREGEPGTEAPRALRGGSWINNQRGAAVAYRFRLHPGLRSFNFGFRVCLASPIVDD